MAIKIEREKQQNKLVLSGDITIDHGHELKQKLQEASDQNILLELHQVCSLDSYCLQLILSAHITQKKMGHTCRIQTISKIARKVFTLSGLSSLLSR